MSTSLMPDHRLRAPASNEGHAGGKSRMMAVSQAGYGSPEVLELRELDRPPVGDGEVLVRVHAAGVTRESGT